MTLLHDENSITFPRNGEPVDGPYCGDRYSPNFWIKDGFIYTAEDKIEIATRPSLCLISGYRTEKMDVPNYSERTDEDRAKIKAAREERERAEIEECNNALKQARATWDALTDDQRESLERFMDREFWR